MQGFCGTKRLEYWWIIWIYARTARALLQSGGSWLWYKAKHTNMVHMKTHEEVLKTFKMEKECLYFQYTVYSLFLKCSSKYKTEFIKMFHVPWKQTPLVWDRLSSWRFLSTVLLKSKRVDLSSPCLSVSIIVRILIMNTL